MTDFEQIKTELHKLVDGLDEKLWRSNFTLLRADSDHIVTDFTGIINWFRRAQKEPTLEEQLQELGFVDERTTSGLPKLSYIIPKHQLEDSDTVWLCFTCGSHTFTLQPRRNKEKEIIKCAKFLKELRDE
jgi:hypothetical protein